ncbi:MAG: hypothetical protein Q8M17_10685 [Actinomycetota bacterium]|nr:hypothetical protein [Actinomycetota bacterium]
MSSTPNQGDIRTWAIENGIPCNAKGNLPKAVTDAYWDAHAEHAADPRVESEAGVDYVPPLTIEITLTDAPEWEETIAQQLADLLASVFQAGCDVERARLLARSNA